jgi:hypothetical protein
MLTYTTLILIVGSWNSVEVVDEPEELASVFLGEEYAQDCSGLSPLRISGLIGIFHLQALFE